MEKITLIDLLFPAIVSIAICAYPKTWKIIATHFVTLVHEYGHALMGVLTLGKIHSIKIRHNSTGETGTFRRGGIFAIGGMLTTLSGYPAPILIGLLLIVSAGSDWLNMLTWVMFGFGVFFLLFIRNLFGFLMAFIWIAYFAAVAVLPDYSTQLLLWFGVFLAVGGFRDMIQLMLMYFNDDSSQTDLGILKQHYFLPQTIWFFLMLAGTGFLSFLMIVALL